MKTHTIKTPTAELLVVELPKDSTFRELFGAIGADENNSPNYHLTEYKFSDYTLLGKPDEISEEDATELVEWGDADPSGDRFMIGYRSYFDGYKDDVPQYTSKTAKESLLSAIETVVFWENPLGTKRNVEKMASFKSKVAGDNLIELWRKAELRTFDRTRTLIFVKN